MGFFSFLTGQQDPPPDFTKPVPVPKGAKVRRGGEDFWRGDEQWASESDEIKPEDTTPLAVEGEDYDVTKHKVKKAHADIQGAFGEALKVLKARPSGGDPGTPEPGPGSVSIIGRQDAADLENALTAALKRENPIKLADDLRVIGSRKTIPPDYANKLFGAADKLTKAYQAQGELEALRKPGQPLAVNPQEVSGRKEYLASEIQKREEALKTAGSLRSPKIQQELKALREEEGRVNLITQQNAAQQLAPGVAPTLPASATPIQDYLKGFGLDKGFVTQRLHAALGAIGIPPEKWQEDVDPRSGVLRVMSELDKNGGLADAMARQLQEARQQDANDKQNAPQQEPEDPRIARTEARIGQREAELRQLYASLRDNNFMRTWPGIILYVLVGLITQNPAFAARLIGGRDNRAAVAEEIKGIQHELARLDRQLARDIDRDVMSKREAARRLQQKEDETDRRKWEVSKLMLQHNLIIQRNAKNGNPETFMMKKLAAEFQRALGMASKYSGEMQNEFADPKVRAAARQNFNTYMQRAAELDADIRNMGGAVLNEESEE